MITAMYAGMRMTTERGTSGFPTRIPERSPDRMALGPPASRIPMMSPMTDIVRTGKTRDKSRARTMDEMTGDVSLEKPLLICQREWAYWSISLAITVLMIMVRFNPPLVLCARRPAWMLLCSRMWLASIARDRPNAAIVLNEVNHPKNLEEMGSKSNAASPFLIFFNHVVCGFVCLFPKHCENKYAYNSNYTGSYLRIDKQLKTPGRDDDSFFGHFMFFS